MKCTKVEWDTICLPAFIAKRPNIQEWVESCVRQAKEEGFDSIEIAIGDKTGPKVVLVDRKFPSFYHSNDNLLKF